MISLADLAPLLAISGPDPELVAIRAQMRGVSGYFPSSSPGASGMGAPFSVDTLVRGAVRSATFRSNVSPSFTWDPNAPVDPAAPPTDPSSGSSLGSFMSFVQPTVDVQLASGDVVTIAPAGPATGDYKVIVAGVVVAIVSSYLLAAFIGYRLGKRRRGR